MLISLIFLYLESIIPIVGPILFLVHSSLLSAYMFLVAEYHFISYLIIYTIAAQSDDHAAQVSDETLTPENLLIYPFRRAYVHAIIVFVGTFSSSVPLSNIFLNLLIIVADFANLVLL